MHRFSRRDFLKFASVVSGGLAVSKLSPNFPGTRSNTATALPNILIFVFDAMSAENLSLHGYRRKTTPNLERFANRATVYNQHYSAGSFTTPGTASLLTGLYPWTHRAINEGGLIARNLSERNLFRVLGKSYYRLAYSQNIWPNYFFGQFQRDIEKILSPAAFSVLDQVVAEKFGADLANSQRAFDDLLFQDGFAPASLVFGLLENLQLYAAVANASAEEYPDGLPHTENYPIYFRVKDVFDGLMATVENLNEPSLVYLHIWPPHEPYRPSKSFDQMFLDGWSPGVKPGHKLVDPLSHHSQQVLDNSRLTYDQYIANLDAEFGRWIDFLDAKGILDHSYVIVTSDHGEMFERGVSGHITPLLYDPIVHVPLLISAPGQKSRQDVNLPTNSVDLLPTLVHLSGDPVPDWCEGHILPGQGGVEEPERSIFMMDAKQNPSFSPLSNASFAIRKGPNKLIYYKGFSQYGKRDRFEMYDIKNDPNELNDLFTNSSGTAGDLRTELLARIKDTDAKYGA